MVLSATKERATEGITATSRLLHQRTAEEMTSASLGGIRRLRVISEAATAYL
jgi:hypothetical protein